MAETIEQDIEKKEELESDEATLREESVTAPPQNVAAEEETSAENEPVITFKKRPLYKRPAFLIIASIILIIGLVIGIRYWLYARSHETTDDAFIDGRITQVSPKVSGYIVKLHVTDNQLVKEGDLLAEIDAREFETRLQQAQAALNAGLAHVKEARAGVQLTRANTQASVQQAAASVQQAQSGVTSEQAGAAAERTRIAQATAAVSAAQANVAQARSQVAAAQAEVTRTAADVTRYRQLFQRDEISRQVLDQAVAAANTATAQLNAARERVRAAEAQVNEAQAVQKTQTETARRAQSQVGGARAGVNEALGRLAIARTAPQQVAVSQAQAETASATLEELRTAVDQAQLQLSYTKIYAPSTGRVTRKAIEEGAFVQPGAPLFAIVSGEVWITANFKEDQLGDLRPGQSVEISVDAYPDKVFKGHVDSIQAGTGSRFSLIPPENATGNYVKVVQRVPVKILFDEQPDPNHMLAPGMSVVPSVKVK